MPRSSAGTGPPLDGAGPRRVGRENGGPRRAGSRDPAPGARRRVRRFARRDPGQRFAATAAVRTSHSGAAGMRSAGPSYATPGATRAGARCFTGGIDLR